MAAHHPCSSATSLPPGRRGRLRNGATPGDFLAAPRCGAHTRSGESCRQPAMKNGRCRMHGGLSTGPRTADGRARCAAARRTHGFYSAEMVALRRAGAAYCRRMDALIAALRIRRTAGHGVLPQNLRNATVGAAPYGRPTADGRPLEAVPTAATAGHGLLPSVSARPLDSTPDRTPAAARPASSASLRLRGESSNTHHAPTAGHGVLPSFSARPGFVQRALLGGTALGLGVTVKPPVPTLRQRIPLPTASPECFNSR
jgi:hypothetical protein